MQVSVTTSQLSATQAKLLGGATLAFLASFAGIGMLMGLIFILTGQAELWPTFLYVIMAVGTLVFTVLSIYVLRRAAQEFVELQSQKDIEGLAEVTGPLPDLTTPAPLESVTQALLALNDKELPYSVSVDEQKNGAKITVETRSQEQQWRSLFGRGSSVFRWRMVINLNENRGTYSFIEQTSTARATQSAASLSSSQSASWHWGKTMGHTAVSRVWSVGEVKSPAGKGHSGLIKLRPADTKIPVFTMLRAYGWRPRRDGVVLRLFEY